MTLILPGLYLGDENDARNVGDKTMVVNCTKHIPFFDKNNINLRIPVNDPGRGCSITDKNQQVYLETVLPILDKIDEELKKGGKVLVHCHAGIQRSVATVLLYLVLKARWYIPPFTLNPTRKKYEYAKKYIIKRRPVAFYGGEFMSFGCAIREILNL